MLHEGRHAGCRSGRDKGANFIELLVLESDGDLRGSHTKNHTTQKTAIDSGLSPRPNLRRRRPFTIQAVEKRKTHWPNRPKSLSPLDHSFARSGKSASHPERR